jgi:hypothetical protein
MMSDRQMRGMIPDWAWVILIGSASILLSLAFACATPFAALATLAAFTLSRRAAIGLVLFTWATNQAVGFGLLQYPTDASTVAWGVAVGLAALAGLATAMAGARWTRVPPIAAMVASLVLSYAAYEAVLWVATLVLPSGSGAFVPSVVAWIFVINAIALVLLLLAGWVVGRAPRAILHPRTPRHSL